jgi:DNA-binding beta-propeller fold protein YncE
MSEFGTILERAREQFPAPEMPLDGLLRRSDRRRRNRRIGNAALALVVAAAGIGGVIRAFDVAERQQPANETPPEPVAIPIDFGASYVEAGDGSVWVLGANGISRVDPVTKEVIASIPVQLRGYQGRADVDPVAVGGGSVWVVDGIPGAAQILRIDPATNEVVAAIPVDGFWALAADGGSVWASGGDELLRIVTATDAVTTITAPQRTVFGVAFLDGTVWVIATPSRGIFVAGEPFGIDPTSGEVVAHIPEGGQGLITAGFGSLWLTSVEPDRRGGRWGASTITRLDPSTGSVLKRFVVDGSSPFLAAGEGAMWAVLTDYHNDWDKARVVRIDPGTNRITGEIRLTLAGRSPLDQGGQPPHIAVGEGAVWITDGYGTLYRIDPAAFGDAS